jgi:hypothetical protein
MDIRRSVVPAAIVALMLALLLVAWRAHMKSQDAAGGVAANTAAEPTAAASGPASMARTTVYAHNLKLRKGPDFLIYVRWLRGEMEPTRRGVPPSLDDQQSFYFRIDRGLIHANLGDIENYLNSTLASRSPLKQMKLRGEGQQMKLSGTLHKLLIPLPVEIMGTISPASNGRVHVRVEKINVLKLPVKGLLGGLKIDIGDIMGAEPVPGVEVQGNDLYLDTSKLLPPPHIRGQITLIAIQQPDVAVTYGDTTPGDEKELAEWHNFLRLRGGTVEFGKLSMRDADLTLIDASGDTWFDLDLANYQQQLAKGYSRITPDKGLEMFMPDVGKSMPQGEVSLETLRDRRRPLPQPTTK